MDVRFSPDSNGQCDGYLPGRSYNCKHCVSHFETPSVLLTLHWRGFTIRQYKNGYWDAASNSTPMITPGFQCFGDVMDFLLTTR